MDQDRFFFEVDRQEAELDEINLELNELAEFQKEAKAQEEYQEFLQALFAKFYEELGDDLVDF